MTVWVNGRAHSVPWSHRVRGITASEIASVLGIHPYVSPFALYHRKLGNLPEQAVTAGMASGKRLEASVVAFWRSQNPGRYVRNVGTLANRFRPWQMATPDRLIFSKRKHAIGNELWTPYGVQAKTDVVADGWGKDGSDDVPLYIKAQCIWEMDTYGGVKTYVPVLLGGSEWRILHVMYDLDEARYLRGEADAFRTRLATGEPPPLDWMDSTADALKALNLDVERRRVVVPDELAAEYRMAAQARVQAGRLYGLASNRLRAAMGSAAWAVDSNGDKIATRSTAGGLIPTREIK